MQRVASQGGLVAESLGPGGRGCCSITALTTSEGGFGAVRASCRCFCTFAPAESWCLVESLQTQLLLGGEAGGGDGHADALLLLLLISTTHERPELLLELLGGLTVLLAPVLPNGLGPPLVCFLLLRRQATPLLAVALHDANESDLMAQLAPA